ncbi:MAG: ATP-binding cassette domain-containing protein [Patescibacteria group bacterium]|jgi:cell division transport system ATP-binding protein
MPIVRYINVTKQFTPESYGVLDVSFEIEPGELVVITGHTGSGKTTLMKLLTREYTVSEGQLFFKDTPVHELKSNKVHLHRRQIGVVYQDYRLIKELTVWENVALPLYIAGKKEEEIEQRTTDLLNLIKLEHLAYQFPSQLSGGEAQRVSIARSLALAPELIFADEPTGNLDSDTSKTIAQLLAKINELGTTVLLSTHDLTLLDVFTDKRHIQLEKGAIVKDSGAKKSSSSSQKSDQHETEPTEADEPVEDKDSEERKDIIEVSLDEPKLDEPKKPFWHKLKITDRKKSEHEPKKKAVAPKEVDEKHSTEHKKSNTSEAADKHAKKEAKEKKD